MAGWWSSAETISAQDSWSTPATIWWPSADIRRASTPSAERITADLSTAGFRVECHPQVMNLKWWKLLLNVNNALLALLGSWLQKAHSDPNIYPLMADVMGESLSVLRKANIHPQAPQGLPPIEATIEKLRNGGFACEYDLPAERRTYPSTWQDLRLQRQATEVDFLNGEIVRLGKDLGVPTPLNSILVNLIHLAVEHKDPPGKYTLKRFESCFMQGGQVEASGGRKDYRSQAAEYGSWAWLSLDWNSERLPAHRPPKQKRRGAIHAFLF